MVDNGNLHIGSYVVINNRILPCKLFIRADGNITIDGRNIGVERSTHLNILIDVIFQGGRPLFSLVIGVGYFHIASCHNGEIPIKVIANVISFIAGCTAKIARSYFKPKGIVIDFTAPLHCIEVHSKARVVRVSDNLFRMRLDIFFYCSMRS